MAKEMPKHRLEKLHLSTRALNVLHKMGVYYVEQLKATPIEMIAHQHSVGTKTLNEIINVVENIDFSVIGEIIHTSYSGCFINATLSHESLTELSHHSIDELKLSERTYNALKKARLHTLDDIVVLTDSDFSQLQGIGKKSIEEIKVTMADWVKNFTKFDISAGISLDGLNDSIKTQFRLIEDALAPIVHIYWKELYYLTYFHNGNKEMPVDDIELSIKQILTFPEIQSKLTPFWNKIAPSGIVNKENLSSLNLPINYNIFFDTLIDASLAFGSIKEYRGCYIVCRDSYVDVFDKFFGNDERTALILQFRTEGETLQEIGDLYGLTRERVRQITTNAVKKLPLLFEDYFSEPFCYFHFSASQLLRAFPELTEEGIGYLFIRYKRGKKSFDENSLKKYKGAWKSRLVDFLQEETEFTDRITVSRVEMVMRVLISNSDTPLTMDAFERKYYEYLNNKDFPIERLKLNVRSITNFLRNFKGVVFNKENEVRFCNVDPSLIWENINFMSYKNTTISTELIYKDYEDLMIELDIRDAYELFYVIKTSLSMWDNSKFKIKCRRVPVIVMGDASEEEQALKLLKEISPVSFWGYYAAYEERYGVRKESAAGNPTISNSITKYYCDGQYSIDVPAIDEKDIQALLEILNQKRIWFIDEIESIFSTTCLHSSPDALNEAAFKRIGYSFRAGYAYNSQYGPVTNFLDCEVFNKDVINLKNLDRRLINLSIFSTILEKKKNSFEYIETAPKVLMSINKFKEVYGINLDDIKQLQSDLSVFYSEPYFNGHSIWNEAIKLPLVKRLQDNDWLLTCIMRQQNTIGSFAVSGGLILSRDCSSLNLNKICEWIASTYGKLTINSLTKTFNSNFGTTLPASKLAEKLKSGGLWDSIVTTSVDDYIDGLINTDYGSINENDLFDEMFL